MNDETDTLADDVADGCAEFLLSFVLLIVGIILLLGAWWISFNLVTAYNDSRFGVLIGLGLLPACVSVGTFLGSMVLVMQFGSVVLLMLLDAIRKKFTAPLRWIFGSKNKSTTDEKEPDTAADDARRSEPPREEITEETSPEAGHIMDEAFWFVPAIVGVLVGVIATCWVAAFLLGMGAGQETPGFFIRGLVLTVVHVPLMAIVAIGKAMA